MTTREDFLAYFEDKTISNPLRANMVNLSGNIEQDMDNLGLPNSNEGIAMIGLAFAASLIPGSTITKGFSDIYGITITGKFPKTFVPSTVPDPNGSGTIIDRDMGAKEGGEPIYFPSRADPTEYGEYGYHNITVCPDSEAMKLYNAVVMGMSSWKGHFFNLKGASEVKDLTPSQISSYFAWHGSEGIEGNILSKHFPSITGGLHDITSYDDTRAMLSKGRWMDYRLTFASGGLLFNKMLDECPEEYLKIFSQSTISNIRAYGANTHSEETYRNIPEKALAVLYSYLLATDQVPDDLFGPKRFYDDLTIQEKETLKNIFDHAKKKMKVYKPNVLGFKVDDVPGSLRNI